MKNQLSKLKVSSFLFYWFQPAILDKKQEAKHARKFAKNFSKALRDELVISIDTDEIEPNNTFVDKGERIKHRNNSENVLDRVWKSTKHENQPILWTGVAHRNQWYLLMMNLLV